MLSTSSVAEGSVTMSDELRLGAPRQRSVGGQPLPLDAGVKPALTSSPRFGTLTQAAEGRGRDGDWNRVLRARIGEPRG